MSEVPISLVRATVNVLELLGFDCETHARDLPHLRDLDAVTGSRVPWNEVATLFNRTGDTASPSEQERIGEMYMECHPFFALGARVLGCPRRTFYASCRVNPHAFPFLKWAHADQPDGSVRFEASLPSQFVGSTLFFRAIIGQMRALPRPLGLPDAECDGETHSHGGIYRIRFPEARPIPGMTERIATVAMDGLMQLVIPFFRRDSDHQTKRVNRVLVAQRRWGLTRTEALVADRLADGLAPPAIAESLKIKVDTVRTHLKRAYAKTGAHRQSQLVQLMTELDSTEPLHLVG